MAGQFSFGKPEGAHVHACIFSNLSAKGKLHCNSSTAHVLHLLAPTLCVETPG
ncbi:uncharacterized protein G2W53_042387 [Senna tora]|uniref:Uncharacterized protein n=1 Tax=Senna tora TaxID=362788 RepID=A0A834SH54_9FABA|nr:uncharacterized protein G2W53_042387 [Senna tora]